MALGSKKDLEGYISRRDKYIEDIAANIEQLKSYINELDPKDRAFFNTFLDWVENRDHLICIEYLIELLEKQNID